jgi:MFS family permease
VARTIEPKATPRLPATVLFLGLASFLTDVASEMIFPLLPVFVAGLGGGATFFGLIEGLAEATASLCKLASGWLSDRGLANKPLVLAGYGLATAVRPLVALAAAPWHVLAVRVTDRIGKGIRTTPRDVLLGAAAPPGAVGRAFGFHRAMDHAGAMSGPLLATLLLGFGWSVREIFWAAVVPGTLALVAVAFVREPPVRPRPEKAGPPVAPPMRLYGYVIVVGIFALGNSTDAFLLLRAHELGIPTALLPVLWALLHLSKATSAYFGGALADRIPRARLITAGWGLFAITHVGFALATAAWQVWVLLLVFGVYHGLVEPAAKALVQDLTPPEARGRAFGIYHFTTGIGALAAGLFIGALWEHLGSTVALGTSAALAALASLLLSRVSVSRPPRA